MNIRVAVAVCLVVFVAVCAARPQGGRRGPGGRHGGLFGGRRTGGRRDGLRDGHESLCKMARRACLVKVGEEILKEKDCEGIATCDKDSKTRQEGDVTYTFTFCSVRPSGEKCGLDHHRRGKGPSSRPGKGPAPTEGPEVVVPQPQVVLPPQTDSEAEEQLCEQPLWKSSACLITDAAGEVSKNVSCEHNGECTAGPGEYSDGSTRVTVYFCEGCEEHSGEKGRGRGRGGKSSEESSEDESSMSEEDAEEEEEETDSGNEGPLGGFGQQFPSEFWQQFLDWWKKQQAARSRINP